MRKATLRLIVAGQSLDLHYAVAGEGPVLLLLHPSPLSLEFMRPLMQRLRRTATVIAIDTPGFGASSAVANPAGDLAVYAATVQKFAETLGLSRYAVYGSATGAQIAIELAKLDEARVSGIIVDNAAVFTDQQAGEIMDGYFPDLTPQPDGRHLATIWNMAHDGSRYFPWHRRRAANIIAPEFAAAAAMQATALGFLEAGPEYADAYRAAFANERAERLQDVTAPVVVMRWAGSILKPYTDQLDGFTWRENVHMAMAGPSVEERWSTLESQLHRVLHGEAHSCRELERQQGSFCYVDSTHGQIRVRLEGEVPRRLVLHELGADGALLAELEDGDVGLDLPGHGGSVEVAATLSNCRDAVDAVTAHFHLPDMAELSLEGAEPVSLEPRQGGGHLLDGWQWLRRRSLAADQPPDAPVRMNRRLAALLRAAPAHRQLYARLYN